MAIHWEKLLYLNKKLLKGNTPYLRVKLNERRTKFEKDIFLCIERFISENISPKGWVLYDIPIDGLYCFYKEYAGYKRMYIDFEIVENSDYLEGKYAVPCVTVNTQPIMFQSIKKLFLKNMHLMHDMGNTSIH